MMPLVFSSSGEENIIKRISGSPEIKKHLEDLGFVVGGVISVLSTNVGGLIVKVKESRIALSREMAGKIMI